MPNEKISGFTSGAPLVGTDLFVIARAGDNYKVTATNIATFVGSSFAMWQADATLATYITPISFSNQTLPGILRLGSSSTTEAFTQEWQNGGALGGGAIYTSLDSSNTGYFQWFQTTNRIAQGGYTGSGGRWAVNSNSFTGGAVGGYTGILHLRTVDASTEAGLLITSPTTPSNTIQVLRVADAANVFHFMDNTGRSYAPNGSVSLPAWSFLNDQDCGLYRVTTNELALSTNASRLIGFNATQTIIPVSREFVVYGTADETTNYERLRVNHSSSLVNFISEAAGTGTARAFTFEAANATTFNIYRPLASSGVSFNFQGQDAAATRATYVQIFSLIDVNTVGATYGFFRVRTRQNGALGTAENAYDCMGYARGSSGTGVAHTFFTNVNQSGTAAYTAHLISITETATGSGTKLAEQITVGGTPIYSITSTGAVTGLSYTSGAPAGGTAATAKFGVYIAGVTVPTGAVEFESGGVTYLLSAVAK